MVVHHADVITGSTAAPAALLFQEAVDASQGRLLHQPRLQPPLATNITAIAQSRFGWEGALDIKVPAGVKLLGITGPSAANQRLPPAAYASGTTQMPVTLLIAPGAAAAASQTAAAAADAAASGSTPAVPGAGSTPPSSPAAAAAVPGPDAGPMQWSSNAVSVPVLSSSTRFVAAFELARDWPTGSSFDVQVVCEWTAVDGRRVRQVGEVQAGLLDKIAVCVMQPTATIKLTARMTAELTPGRFGAVCAHNHIPTSKQVLCTSPCVTCYTCCAMLCFLQVISQTVHISDRLGPFMEGLDVPAVVLLTSQRLVASAAAAVSGQGTSSSSGGGLRLATEPPQRAVEEARLSVGMALAHVAQRMGHAHLSRRGLFGFGAQQVGLEGVQDSFKVQTSRLVCNAQRARLSSVLAVACLKLFSRYSC